jgi:hypothetical protein
MPEHVVYDVCLGVFLEKMIENGVLGYFLVLEFDARAPATL